MKTTLLFLSVFLSANLFGQKSIDCSRTAVALEKNEICLIEFDGYNECYLKFKKALDLYGDDLNQTLGWYLAKADYSDWLVMRPIPPLDISIKVFIPKYFKGKKISRSDYEQLKSSFEVGEFEKAQQEVLTEGDISLPIESISKLSTKTINVNIFGMTSIGQSEENGSKKNQLMDINFIFLEQKGIVICTGLYSRLVDSKSITDLLSVSKRFNLSLHEFNINR